MIELTSIKKRYVLPRKARRTDSSQHEGRYFYALNGISMRVCEGEVHGLIGPNGSGKSTLMRLIAGLITPTEGTLEIAGQKINTIRRAPISVGYLPASGKLYPHLTVQENIQFFAKLAREPKDTIKLVVARIIRDMGCEEVAHLNPESLSFGMYQKVRLARLLAIKPKALLLDEPSTGVDIVGINAIDSVIRVFSQKGIPIIIATHNLSEIEDYCATFSILDKGRAIFSGTQDELLSQSGHRSLKQGVYASITGSSF